MKTSTKALMIAGGFVVAYKLVKGISIPSIPDFVEEIGEEIEEVIGEIYVPDEANDLVVQYFSEHFCEYWYMRGIIEGTTALVIPEVIRNYIPIQQLTATQMIQALFNWSMTVKWSQIMTHYGFPSGLGGDPNKTVQNNVRLSNGWEWVVTQFEEIINWIDVSGNANTVITVS